MGSWRALLLALAAHAAQAQTRARPEVALNHFSVVLDSVTLAAVESSAFLTTEFAHYRRTTTSNAAGRSWTGQYLFGERTYLELFPRGEQGGVGFSGLALSVEEPGAIDSVAAWLDARFDVPIRRRLVEGMYAGRSVRWFHSVSVEHERGDSLWQVNSWVMENHPEFFRVVQGDSTGPEGDISRRRYLRRRYQPERMVREIVGLSMSLYPPIGEQLAGELEALGWRLERGAEPGRYRAVGAEADIVVTPVPQGVPYGIREIRFALNRGPAAKQTHQIGDSRLEVCATAARWLIGAPPATAGGDSCR